MSLRQNLVVLGWLLFCGQSASAAFMTSVNNNSPQFVDEVLVFETSGDLMGGMVVTAFFADNTSNSAIWLGGQNPAGNPLPLGGSATVSDFNEFGYQWTLVQQGDTFQMTDGNEWVLRTNGNNSSNLTRLVIDARPGSVVFDRILNPEVTPNSEFGRAATQQDAGTTFAGNTQGTYRLPVTVGFGTPLFPTHDLYGVLDLTFDSGGVGANETVAFWADTDNTNAPAVPEPSSGVLIALLAGGFAFRRRRV